MKAVQGRWKGSEGRNGRWIDRRKGRYWTVVRGREKEG